MAMTTATYPSPRQCAWPERGVHVETFVFPDGVHGFLLHSNWLAAYRTAADFFDRMLKQGQAAEVDQAGNAVFVPRATGPAESRAYLQLFERRCDGE